MSLLSSVKRTSIATFTFVTMLCALSANANPLEDMPSGTYTLDRGHASVIWKVSHFGYSTYVGRFNNFSADISLDTENFEKSRVEVNINVDSLDTDYPFPEKEDFNKELAEDWFKSAEYPSIIFKATSVSALDGASFTIDGDLTLMGQTHPVSLDATLNGATPLHPFARVPLIGFSATTSIDRTLWGLSKYAPKIGEQVSIEIEGEFLNKAK